MRPFALLPLLCLAACGGSTPGAQTAPASEPVEVVIAPLPASAEPAASSAPSATPAPSPEERAAKIAEELSRLDVAMVGALGSNDGVPMGMLDSAAGVGVGVGGVAGLRMGGGGGTIQPGSGGGLAGIGSGNVGGTPGTGGTVKGPVGAAAVEAISGDSGVSNAKAVIAGMSAGFRRCYNKGLMQDPSMKGTIGITATLGKNGEVVSVAPSAGKGLSGTVVSCVAARVSSAQFAPPDKGTATLKFNVKLTSQ